MGDFYRVSLGRGAAHAALAKQEGWIGVDWFADIDLTGKFPEQWRDFNAAFIPVYMQRHSQERSKIAAGLACGMTWTVCKGIQEGDNVISSLGDKQYQVGKVSGDYYYAAGQPLPHRRTVRWLEETISKDQFSEALQRAIRAIGTVQTLRDFNEELDRLIAGDRAHDVVVNVEDVESPYTFVLERYLEDFLVSNWKFTSLGQDYDIYEENGELVGQQYQSDTGPIDILAVSKDKKTLLVVELKRGKVSDVVVGQIQRYMGYVKEELLEPGQEVRGVIIGLDDDKKIQRALSVTTNIEFYKYEVNFKLHKGY